MSADAIREIRFSIENLKYFQNLQSNGRKIEYNGQIIFDKEGNLSETRVKEGQLVEPCMQGCLINFHTHPNDFDHLYPEHPSTTDMTYILYAISHTKELSVHMIFCPTYIYLITVSTALRQSILSGAVKETIVTTKNQALFQGLSAQYDRHTNEFREKWRAGLQEIGYTIAVHTGYDDPFSVKLFEVGMLIVPKAHKGRLLAYLVCALLVFWLYKRLKI